MSNNIQTRVTDEGRTIAFRVDEDGNQHRLNPAEEKQYLEAKAYKASLAKKVGQGAALAGGIAVGEAGVAAGTAAATTVVETAVAVTEAIAWAPIIVIGGTFLGIGLGVKWLMDQTDDSDNNTSAAV